MSEILPNFLLVGVPKSGSTSVFYYLKNHPEIFLPTNKEPRFFISEVMNPPKSDPYFKSIKQNVIYDFKSYKNLFQDRVNEKLIGEASVGYMYHHHISIPKILRYLGERTKIIIILRNPVERAISTFAQLERDKFRYPKLKKEFSSFRDCLQKESEWISNNWHYGFHLIALGLYHDRVKNFIDNFSQVKIVLFDDLKKNSGQAMKEIFQFLGVKNIPIDTSIRYNASKKFKYNILNNVVYQKHFLQTARRLIKNDQIKKMVKIFHQKYISVNQPAINVDEESVEHLIRTYEPDIKKTQTLINRNLKSWTQNDYLIASK